MSFCYCKKNATEFCPKEKIEMKSYIDRISDLYLKGSGHKIKYKRDKNKGRRHKSIRSDFELSEEAKTIILRGNENKREIHNPVQVQRVNSMNEKRSNEEESNKEESDKEFAENDEVLDRMEAEWERIFKSMVKKTRATYYPNIPLLYNNIVNKIKPCPKT